MTMEESKPDYSSFFYFNPLPSWVYELDTFRILDVNEAAIDHYGYSRSEFLTLTLKDIRPHAEIPQLVAAHAGVQERQGNIYFGVFTHQKKTGDHIRMKINGHKVDYLGKACMIVVCQDVTLEEEQFKKLEESEKALRESEARFRTIFEIASLGIAQVDPAIGKIVLVNTFYETITGYSKKELMDMSFVALTHPDDREKDWDKFSKAMRGEVEYRNEKRYVRKDGSIVWVRVHLAFIRDDAGRPYRTVAICENISEKKEEEHRLKLLESVITNTHDAILITEAEPFDEPGPKIVYVNEAFTNMTGYSAEEAIGRSPRFLQGPKSDWAELGRLGNALRNWESCEITTINYRKNGSEFWVNLSISPVANEKGWFTHWVAIQRDISEQKQKEREKDLLGKVSLNFSIETSLSSSLAELCHTIAAYGDFDCVELWLPNIEKTEIRLMAHHATSSNGLEFYKYSEGITTFHFSEGLPGRVWQQKATVLWDKLDEAGDFVRKESADRANFQAVLGIPLFHNDEVVGVLVVASCLDVKYLQGYMDLLNRFKGFIGSEINRKKLENDLSHLYHAIPDIICVVDFQGRFLKINQAGCELLGYSESEILFKSFEEFIFPDDRVITSKELASQIQGNDTFYFENRYLTKTGEICWLSWTCNTSPEEGLVYASAKNITNEKRLRELNQLSSKLAKVGSWEIDVASDKLFWSNTLYEMHETKPEDFTPELENAISLYKEEYREFVRNIIAKAIETGEPFAFEAVLVTFENNEKWVRAIGETEMVDGRCTRIYGSFQDIHTSKSLEIQIREILGSISDAFYALNSNWEFTYFNKEAERLLSRLESEVIGKNIWEVFPSIVGTHLEDVYYRVAATGQSESIEYLRNRDGNWYEISAYPFSGGISVYFKNIHERKHSVAQLESAYLEKEHILERIGDAFFALDKDWKVTYWNKRAEEILGFPREDLVGYKLWEKFPLAQELDFFKQYERAFETQQPVHFEEFYKPTNQWFEANGYPSPEGISVFFRDISGKKIAERKVLELNESLKQHIRKLELTNEELEQFAFVTSHDLQEPLRMISSFMEQLRKRYGDQLDEKAHQYIQFATGGAKRMRTIILDLLEYSRAGRFADPVERIVLKELLDDYQLLRRKLIAEKKVQLSLSKLPVVECYKAPLTQTIHCLMDNAIRYSRPGVSPRVTVEAEEKGAYWKIRVADNGIGIAPENFEKIFVVFQRLHPNEKYEGTGIGLSIAKKNVESWGGEIWVESTIGMGSVFYFTIPKP
ncbi:MAG: PAS domain S-box protein [Lunatimonas sp.]|uniref:PAS domain S-box protein n=1 Tax=Lunatimonas sp. TaxID=2060141 RepID=UPI00263AA023|nr:PAS domain S-box protein [Lunatimonas sp.]MCC5938604.1 PAS domain S-box protein [Lunatimonas sp.]